MPRRRAHAPLDVFINNRLVGHLAKENDGAVRFGYASRWLEWQNAFAVSLSLPLRSTQYAGAPVAAVFDNLLPDNPDIRRRVAERTGAEGTDAYSLLEEIGRDCVGAMQFLHEGEQPSALSDVQGERISIEEIEKILANLARAPLGMDVEQEFRISVAGAQEKTALLHHRGRWLRPRGTTPTTHILKPQLGLIPTAVGPIDMDASVDNEHYCLTLLEEFGLKVAQTRIDTFGKRRVLVVERFDRLWRGGAELLRLPQEDCCQALGVPPARKYQSDGGPSAAGILKLLQQADEPVDDQAAFFRAIILFWLIGATDGHGKNFSIFLRPGGRYALTPFYDVLTAQPAFDRRQIPHRSFRLAMSAGKSRKYKILDISGRHFVETGLEGGMGRAMIFAAIRDVLDNAVSASERALARMPEDFATEIHESVRAAIGERLARLEGGLAEI
ncbi:type II toxin-antitoxin system HipA family toxin [Sphingomonas sp. IW22]|uniref:type II toxin-antitoxin system HipA family toxin n=1 Tax=Sphingomonas sp. IW22 TaxID=3242489 RepID=UPI003521C296